jgi:hypothetical protein
MNTNTNTNTNKILEEGFGFSDAAGVKTSFGRIGLKDYQLEEILAGEFSEDYLPGVDCFEGQIQFARQAGTGYKTVIKLNADGSAILVEEHGYHGEREVSAEEIAAFLNEVFELYKEIYYEEVYRKHCFAEDTVVKAKEANLYSEKLSISEMDLLLRWNATGLPRLSRRQLKHVDKHFAWSHMCNVLGTDSFAKGNPYSLETTLRALSFYAA